MTLEIRMPPRTAILPIVILSMVGLLAASTCAAQDMVTGASPAGGKARPARYLADGEYADGIALLPPPPAPGSAALALDEALNRQMLALRGTARWKLAARDAIPDPGAAFSCALGLPLSQRATPKLFNLLRRTSADAGAAVVPTKKFYRRERPFLVNEQPICTPGAEEATARDGSYPSGHTAAGWVWALILAELAPDRIDAVLARGREYGQSRAVCNVHWHSDLIQGRVLGTALFARLHANEAFRGDLDEARTEIAAVRGRGLTPDRDCEAEARALAVGSRQADR